MSGKILSGRVALVTGAASGIGAATATALSREGAAVLLADVAIDGAAKLAEELLAAGGVAAAVGCDVSDDGAVAAAVARAVKEFGGLHIAFNNAGIEGEAAAVAECSLENWDRIIAVNLRGVFLCMRHEIPAMLEAGGGSIINCASIAGVVGFAGMPAYVASKHGVIGLTRTAALDYADKNIRVNAVCPGVIQTPMIDRFVGEDQSAREGLAIGAPMGRMGAPEEIASAVVWLAGPGASFTTGHPLIIDGGWVAR